MKRYTEADLEDCLGKELKIICVDDIIVEGFCTGYTRAVDNTPEIAEIGLKTKAYPTGVTSVTLPDIKTIEVIR